jgi:hypothetical protein
MEPRGCSAVTRSRCTAGAKAARHRSGAAVGCRRSNQTPPMPALQASQAPVSEGETGTNSPNRVGRVERESARARKSATVSKTRRFRRTRWESPLLRASCRMENSPLEPGRPGAMDLSSPKILCQSETGSRLRGGCTMSNSAYKRAHRWGGSERVPATVSRSQPRKRFFVLQYASPCLSFLTDEGSLRRAESPAWRGRSTSSIAWRVARSKRRWCR